jgi:DNA-binding CsgD family transcriptional regulator
VSGHVWRQAISLAHHLPDHGYQNPQQWDGLFQSIAELIGVERGAIFAIQNDVNGSGWRRNLLAVRAFNFDAEDTRLTERLIVHGVCPDPIMETLVQTSTFPRVWLRSAIMPDARWHRTEHYEQMRRPCDLEHTLYAIVCPMWGQRLFLALDRGRRMPNFNRAEVVLLHSFLAANPHRLALKPPPDQSRFLGVSLTLRQRDVLQGLLEGMSERQVAARLRLSPHTVHDYVKQLYRAVGVASRAELLSRVISTQQSSTP